jgi:hypothetical protein
MNDEYKNFVNWQKEKKKKSPLSPFPFKAFLTSDSMKLAIKLI